MRNYKVPVGNFKVRLLTTSNKFQAMVQLYTKPGVGNPIWFIPSETGKMNSKVVAGGRLNHIKQN